MDERFPPKPYTSHGDGFETIAEPPSRLTGSAAAIMRPLGLNSIAVAASISAAEVKASPDGVNWWPYGVSWLPYAVMNSGSAVTVAVFR